MTQTYLKIALALLMSVPTNIPLQSTSLWNKHQDSSYTRYKKWRFQNHVLSDLFLILKFHSTRKGFSQQVISCGINKVSTQGPDGYCSLHHKAQTGSEARLTWR